MGAAGAEEAHRPAAERRARREGGGHLRDDGWIDVRERLERGPQRPAIRGLRRTPNDQFPTPNHSRLPTPNRDLKLGVGNWEWLGVGNWELGIDLLHVPVS